MPITRSKRQTAPQPEKELVADFLAAILRVTQHGETVTVHGYTIAPPSGRNPYALRIQAPRTLRDPWTGALSVHMGQQGGSADLPKSTAAALACNLMADRANVARMLADARPGILAGTVTHLPDAAA